MSIGMVKALFTKRKLSDFINGTKRDYVNARRIINGLDKAIQIAQCAIAFEEMLRAQTE